MNKCTKRVKLSGVFASYSERLERSFWNTQDAIGLAFDRGMGREEALRRFLRENLPKRYGVGTGFVISANGHQSRQTDIVIYDLLTCPVFCVDDNPAHSAYPIEGVYATIEVKSTLEPNTFESAWKNALALKKVARPVLAEKQEEWEKRHAKGNAGNNIKIRFVPPVAICFAYTVEKDWGRVDGKAWQVSAIERLKAHEYGYALDLICVLDTGVLGSTFAENIKGRTPMTEAEWYLIVSKQIEPFSLFYLHLLSFLSLRLPDRVDTMAYVNAIMKERRVVRKG